MYNLPVLDSIVQKTELNFGGTSHLILYADSLHIIFDNSRKRLLTVIEDTTSTNILRLGNYKKLIDVNKYYYTYTFSNIDYDSAEDCNGDCE